jgi:hypothetical protein
VKYLSFSKNFSESHTSCRDKYIFTRENTSKSVTLYSGRVRDSNYFQNPSSVTWPYRLHTRHIITAATFKNQHSMLADSSLWLQKDTDIHSRIFTNLVTEVQDLWPDVRGCENNHTVKFSRSKLDQIQQSLAEWFGCQIQNKRRQTL